MVILAAVGEKHGTEMIVETGYDLASAYRDELQVLHVIPEGDVQAHIDALRRNHEFGDFGFDAESDRAEAIAKRLIDAALPSDNSKQVTPVGRGGDPADEILSYADQIDPRYLVIGGRKRTPAGKALFGSVTQQVILDSTRPVVTQMSTI